MELQEALEQRYSCRCFSSEEPTNDQIQAIVEAGRLAPTACNNQPQRVYVVKGDKNLEKLDTWVRNRYGAPVNFIIGYDTTECAIHDPQRFGGENFSFGEQDCVSVLVHMALKATDLGLATVWMGAMNDEQLKRVFDIPENVKVRAVLACGIPDDTLGGPCPRHTERRPLEETTVWL